MLLFLCYSFVHFIEMFLGIWIIHKIYPEPRFQSKAMRLLGGSVFLAVALLVVDNAWKSYISNVAIPSNIILCTLSYILCFKCSLSAILVWESFYSIMISLLKMPILILIGLLQHKVLSQVNREVRNFAEILWCFLIEILIFLLIKKRKDIIKLLKILLFRYKKLLITVFGIEWCMLTYSMYLGKEGFTFIDFVLHLIFIICAVLLMLYLMLNILYREIKSENIILDTIQSNLQNQNDKLQTYYNQNNQQLHDIKHIMIYLRNCLESGKAEEALAQVCEFTDNLIAMERKIWTGFSFLDFVINSKKLEMDDKKIDFELEVDLYEVPFKDAELGVILGNLLDNAIEASQKCEINKRKVFLRICNRNEIFLLCLYNNSVQMPVLKDDRFVTTKEDNYAHGLGVESVKRIVEKYNGNISFQYDDEHFEVDILI
ncbi:GHKL domain-containing protein [Candidatus Merdisoma sp. JLR.KK006]|uniref:ATP-binding protein n=1 Tax=Candidatus Merdisoma sp. JLR.KK006 TaxID=3112626 RepID=UPI002FF2B220